MDTIPLWLPLVFFLVAVLYAMVGFGGGSSYLALLALVGLPYAVIPQTALVCNLIVSAGGVWHFRRGGHLEFGRVLPFVALSVPMAYLGGRLPIGRDVFMVLLGFSLLAAGVRTFIPAPAAAPPRPRRQVWRFGLPVGAALGMLAGLVGIGGGVFLAPVLLLGRFAGAKQTAATASVFILANSAAGLAGQFTKGLHLGGMIVPLAVAVFLGGQFGSRAGSYRLPVRWVRQLLAALIAIVGMRLIWGVVV